MADRDTILAVLTQMDATVARGERVPEWPEDERDFYRGDDWNSFDDRHNKLEAMRREKLADAILTALENS